MVIAESNNMCPCCLHICIWHSFHHRD